MLSLMVFHSYLGSMSSPAHYGMPVCRAYSFPPPIQAIASCKEAFRARYGSISQSLFEELAATRMSV